MYARLAYAKAEARASTLCFAGVTRSGEWFLTPG
jgi:hypothetical protein